MFVAFTDVFENLLIYHNDDMEFLDFDKYSHGSKKIFTFTNKDVKNFSRIIFKTLTISTLDFQKKKN